MKIVWVIVLLGMTEIKCYDDGRCTDPRIGVMYVGPTAWGNWWPCLTSNEIPLDISGSPFINPKAKCSLPLTH